MTVRNETGRFRTQPRSELDDYDRASPAMDCVLVTVSGGSLKVLIHKREHEPQRGSWALPGAFINYGESAEDVMVRTLRDKTGIELACFHEQLEYRLEAGRDPRGWVTTVAYLLLAPEGEIVSQLTNPDALLARIHVPWDGEQGGPVKIFNDRNKPISLAFDHNAIIGSAVRRLRGKLFYTRVGLELMPSTFTLRELRLTYEAILGHSLNRASFQRQVVDVQHLIEATGETLRDVSYRPAALFKPVPHA